MARHIWIWERVAGVLLAAVTASVYVAGGFERPELMTYDWRLRAFPGPPRSDIVIVGIDSPSLKALDTWPWPRSVHAALVDRLTQVNARVIAFDVDFSTPRDPGADKVFARAVKRSGRVVLAAFDDHRTLEGGAVVEYASLPYPTLRTAAQAVGSINFSLDSDGTVRRALIRKSLLGEDGESFAMQVARAYLGALDSPVREADDGALEFTGHRAHLGGTTEFLIRFTGGPWTMPVVSAIDVLHGTVPTPWLADKIVLVGATSLDLQDFRVTPFSGPMAGVEIQANAIATILSGIAPRRMASHHVLGGILVIVIAWTLFLTALRVWNPQEFGRRALWLSLAGAGAIVAIAAGSVILFARSTIVLDMVPLLSAAAGQLCSSLLAGYLAAERGLELHRDNVEALYHMGEATQDRASLDQLADLLYVQARHILLVDRLGLDVWGQDDLFTREWRFRPVDAGSLPIPPDVYNDLVARVRSSGLPVAASDLVVPRRRSEQGVWIRASLFVPLVAHNRVIGILHVHRDRATPFQQREAKTLLTLATQAALNIESGRLLDDVRTLFQRSLEAFSTALDFKDNDTGGHSQRVAAGAREVALRMGLQGDALDHIAQGALLHDIGKIAVPDSILRKPGALSEEEWATMRQHPDTGFRMLKAIHVPDAIAAVVRQHHEKYDGTGYPLGLRGTDISVGARIFSVVDFY
ncbi:MAG TPA: CHASE2 domain-containing protein, partial [Nitrospiria bacterium]|nr:CHASE2 domain-containing protein [Nitrospiria bacterium]